MASTVFSDIDWDQPGRQVGSLFLPHSPDDDAWGVIPFRAASIRNGSPWTSNANASALPAAMGSALAKPWRVDPVIVGAFVPVAVPGHLGVVLGQQRTDDAGTAGVQALE